MFESACYDIFKNKENSKVFLIVIFLALLAKNLKTSMFYYNSGEKK
jgi:hypothetical protein